MENLYTFAERVVDLLHRVRLPDDSWRHEVSVREDCLTYQIAANGSCNVSGKRMAWTGRKWFLSRHMTDGEIVQTVFKACMTAQEHELRERFLYRGAAIFDPHYDIEKLVELRQSPGALKERED